MKKNKHFWGKVAPSHCFFQSLSMRLCFKIIKTNQAGPGSHVCNCGFMLSSKAGGKGLATAMCEYSQQVARELGYKAVQFNFVASTNEGAIRLWAKLGFETVGNLPKAFNHPAKGYVDALVMYKWL